MLRPLNPIRKILGNKPLIKDRYAWNMAIEPEKFKERFEKVSSGGTGKDVMELADELDDESLRDINKALETKRKANEVLEPYGLGGHHGGFDSFVEWRTRSVEDDRKRGERVEVNPRSSWGSKESSRKVPKR